METDRQTDGDTGNPGTKRTDRKNMTLDSGRRLVGRSVGSWGFVVGR